MRLEKFVFYLRGFLYDRLRTITSPELRQRIKRSSLFIPLSKLVFGNSVYSKTYYDDVFKLESKSVKIIADWICKYIKPKTAIDVGCGPGHLMDELKKRGVSVFGVDISHEAIQRARAKGLSAELFDLTDESASLPGSPYDIAISCEVAEHLEEKYAKSFLKKIASASFCVFLTAAEPGDSVGLYHFNEKPNEYWISLMKNIGFELDIDATNGARDTFKKNGVISYLCAPMIFHSQNIDR